MDFSAWTNDWLKKSGVNTIEVCHSEDGNIFI